MKPRAFRSAASATATRVGARNGIRGFFRFKQGRLYAAAFGAADGKRLQDSSRSSVEASEGFDSGCVAASRVWAAP